MSTKVIAFALVFHYYAIQLKKLVQLYHSIRLFSVLCVSYIHMYGQSFMTAVIELWDFCDNSYSGFLPKLGTHARLVLVKKTTITAVHRTLVIHVCECKITQTIRLRDLVAQ